MSDYKNAKRRLLLDMHIPDWDPGLLADFSPREYAELAERAGAEAVIVYCKSHLGLAYWPTPVGGIHAAARERDLVGETVTELRSRGLGVAAYHSVVYDNWAAITHEDWRMHRLDLGTPVGPTHRRYGNLCLNSIEYREYEKQQTAALVQRYDFEALWLDMAFSPGVCGCERCVKRFRDESGLELPGVVNWSDPVWCAFQSARERWTHEFFLDIRDSVRSIRPELPITHNLAPGLRGWINAQNSDGALDDAFAAGDLYGGLDEELFVLALMNALAPTELNEYMTSRTLDLTRHASTKSTVEMTEAGIAALAQGCAFLFIDAIDPRGTLNPQVYTRIGEVFSEMAKYDDVFGGHPVADVAIYYSDASRIDSAADGVTREDRQETSSHQRAAVGAARALRRAHIPFGVLTQGTLGRDAALYKVIVVPNAVRLGSAECEELRRFVETGGQLYASGLTSLLDPEGMWREDFALSDVFGITFGGFEPGLEVFVKPLHEALRKPAGVDGYLGEVPDHSGSPIVRQRGATAIAGRTLPYGYPSSGSLEEHDFASIHSNPPWEDDPDSLTVAMNRFGKGACLYTAFSFESATDPAGEAFFIALLTEVLDFEPVLRAEAGANVVISILDQPERHRKVVMAQSSQDDTGVFRPTSISLAVGESEGTRVRDGVSGVSIPHTVAQGRLTFAMRQMAPLSVAIIEGVAGA